MNSITINLILKTLQRFKISFIGFCMMLCAVMAMAQPNSKEITPAHSQILTSKNRVRSGIALGGIGTGGIEIRKDANFYNWTIFNNYPFGSGEFLTEQTFPNNNSADSYLFFLVRYEVEGENPKLKLLQMNSSLEEGALEGIVYYMPWMEAVDQIKYSARFPFSDFEFTDEEMPFAIEMRAYTPFIPHDVKNSSLPAAYFDFKITNVKKNVDVMILGSLKNLAGYDQVDKYFTSQIVDTTGYKFSSLSAGGLDATHPSAGAMGLGAIGGDEVSYYNGWSYKFPFYEELLLNNKLANKDVTETSNVQNKDNNLIAQMQGNSNLQHHRNAIAVSYKLEAGAERESTFFMSWYFPNAWGAVDKDTERERYEPLEGGYKIPLEKTKIIGHYYSNSFSNVNQVADYMVSKKEVLRSKTEQFLNDMYQSDIPSYVLNQVNSQMNTFITSSTFTKSGVWGLREGLTNNRAWGPNATSDVSLYASVMPLALFPTLQQSMMRAHMKLQTEQGEINHGLGLDMDYIKNGTFGVYERVDLVPNYIQNVLRDYFWTNDKQYLIEMWPSIKKGINYMLEHRDEDGDQMPDMDGIMCSYDNFPMYGLASYIQSQWIASVSLAAIAAKDLNDTKAADEYSDLAKKAIELMESKLWNENYYVLSNDYLGEHGIDKGILTDQLMGQWVAHTAGLDHLFDAKRIEQSLKTILDHSFIEGQFLRNCTWKEYPFVSPIFEKGLWVDQANTPWTGVELAFASFLIYEGMVEEGNAVIKAVDDRYRKAGLYFDHQEWGGHYLRPMSAWAIVNAYLGFKLVKDQYAFAPKFESKTYQSFFVANHGMGHFISDGNEIQLKPTSGYFQIASLKMPSGLWPKGSKSKIQLGGKTIGGITWVNDNGSLTAVFKKPVKVDSSALLKIIP